MSTTVTTHYLLTTYILCATTIISVTVSAVNNITRIRDAGEGKAET